MLQPTVHKSTFTAAQCCIWGFLKKSTQGSSDFASASQCFEAGRCYLSFSIKPELALFIASLPGTQGTTVLKHPFPHRTSWVHNPCRNLENPQQALWGAARKPQHHVPQTSLFADWLQRGPAQPISLDTVKYSPTVSRLSLASEGYSCIQTVLCPS